jgi:hypothetical protein
MKSLFTAFVVILFFSCEPPSSADQKITEQEAQDFITRYDSAWNSKDSVTIQQLLGNNYLYFDSKGGLTTRERTVTIVAAPYYKVLSAKRNEIKVLIHENVATISSRWVGNGIWKDQPFSDNQRCGLILAKNNGKIQLIAEHCTETQDEAALQ